MDTQSLLKLLNANNVRYVVIGATAFPVHGYTRSTLDIDIFIEPSEVNASKTIKALSECGYDVSDLTPADCVKNKILLRQYLLETDIHPYVAGVSFEQVFKNCVEAEYHGVTARFASLEDLIAMKKAANRPKDIEDLKYLEKLIRKIN